MVLNLLMPPLYCSILSLTSSCKWKHDMRGVSCQTHCMRRIHDNVLDVDSLTHLTGFCQCSGSPEQPQSKAGLGCVIIHQPGHQPPDIPAPAGWRHLRSASVCIALLFVRWALLALCPFEVIVAPFGSSDYDRASLERQLQWVQS